MSKQSKSTSFKAYIKGRVTKGETDNSELLEIIETGNFVKEDFKRKGKKFRIYFLTVPSDFTPEVTNEEEVALHY